MLYGRDIETLTETPSSKDRPSCLVEADRQCSLHKAVFDNSPHGILVLDRNGEVLSANKVALDAAPCLKEAGINLFKALGPYESKLDRLYREKSFRAERRLSDLFPASAPEGWGPLDRVMDLHLHTTDDGKIIIHFQDITATRRAEEELRRRNEELDLAICGAGLSYWERDIGTNSYKSDLFPENEPEADPFYSRVHPEDLPRLLAEVDSHCRGLSPHYRCEYRIMIDGAYRWYLGMGMLVAEGGVKKLVGFNQDIDCQKEMEDSLQRSIEEKTEMLREIHHRVNNNLQILKAMVQLRLLEVQDLRAREELIAVESRIMTMARSHGSIYGRENLKDIPAEEHFRDLMSDIIDLHRPDLGAELELACGGQSMKLPEAMGCSFIVNELASSAMRSNPEAEDLRMSVDMWCDDERKHLRFTCNKALRIGDGGDAGLAMVNRIIKSQMGGHAVKGDEEATDWTFYYPV